MEYNLNQNTAFSKKRTDIKNHLLNSVLTCLFMVWATGELNSANHVTVATIGIQPPAFNKEQGMQKIVDQMIGFWNGRLKQVLPDQPDLIVMPEACDRPGGLTREELYEYYEVRKNQVMDFFASVAKKNQCYIVFGTIHKENGVWRNSSILLDRGGKLAGIYHKNFLTIGEMENLIVPGVEAPVFKCDFGTIASAICFDLNFMEMCNEYEIKQPDIIAFSSMYHGGIMQPYWAYQCRSFLVGSMGRREIPSEIVNPLGQVVASSTNYFDFTVATINLDNCLVHLDYNRSKLTKLKEKYGNKVSINDPGKLGSVLITSEHERISVEEMIDEFGIERLNDYFKRSREFRKQQIK